MCGCWSFAETWISRRKRSTSTPAVRSGGRTFTTTRLTARCSLATQHQVVVGSILDAFDSEVQDHLHRRVDPVGPFVVTELRDIDDEGVARWDEDHVRKQPDWSYDDEWSGKVPADLLVDPRAPDHQPG